MNKVAFDDSVLSKCRVCFHEKDEMHSIFKRRKGLSAYDKLISYSKLNIKKNDGGPTLICVHCLTELDVAVNFVIKCEKSNEILASLVDDNSDTLKHSKEDWVEDNHILSEERLQRTDNVTNIDIHKSTQRELLNEIKTISRYVRKPCLVCGARRHCGHVPVKTYPCDICSKHFKKKDNLIVHK